MITIARKFAAFTAASVACALVAMSLTGEAQGSRSPDADVAFERIDAAFAVVEATPAATAQTRPALAKGDRGAVSCAGAAWPAVPTECLVTSDGSAPRQAGRTVTVEYRTGHATSTLVRMPVDLIASR
jgi:hypothetical protein